MQALTSVAQYSSIDVVPQYFVVKARARAFSNANMQFVEMGAHRTRSPFFDYRYVIKTVKLILVWMMSRRRFLKVGTAMAIDRIDLGTGFSKRKKRLRQLRSLDRVPISNQSVASS